MSHRVFVGTLAHGEGELEACRSAVLGQQDVTATHCMISGLPEREAHDALWREWKHARGRHDLFVKVDADTVLLDPWVLRRIAVVFVANWPRLTGMQLPIHDHFTNDLIAGLNAFSPAVRFGASPDLLCDRADAGHDLVLRCPDNDRTQAGLIAQAEALGLVASTLARDEPLVPAASHCSAPTDAQAFRYGLHRALKGQTSVIARVRSAPVNRARLLALAGAEAAWAFRGRPDYDDPVFKEALAGALASMSGP